LQGPLNLSLKNSRALLLNIDNQVGLAEFLCSFCNCWVAFELGGSHQDNNYGERNRRQDLAKVGAKLESPNYDCNQWKKPDQPDGQDRPESDAGPGN
jgi:hypothetical protein